ncbi:hypothetical protein FHR07_16600 [Serratia ureilytica]|nr:hypothetical protein [Serratia ureilytica]
MNSLSRSPRSSPSTVNRERRHIRGGNGYDIFPSNH